MTAVDAAFEASQARRSDHALAVISTLLLIAAGGFYAAGDDLLCLTLAALGLLLAVSSACEFEDAADWSAVVRADNRTEPKVVSE